MELFKRLFVGQLLKKEKKKNVVNDCKILVLSFDFVYSLERENGIAFIIDVD